MFKTAEEARDVYGKALRKERARVFKTLLSQPRYREWVSAHGGGHSAKASLQEEWDAHVAGLQRAAAHKPLTLAEQRKTGRQIGGYSGGVAGGLVGAGIGTAVGGLRSGLKGGLVGALAGAGLGAARGHFGAGYDIRQNKRRIAGIKEVLRDPKQLADTFLDEQQYFSGAYE